MHTNTTSSLSIKGKGFLFKSLAQHKFFVRILKLTLVIVLGAILYHQIFGREDLTLQKLGVEFWQHLSWKKVPLLMLVLVLMPLNWFFETQKWLALMRKIESISFFQALKVVLIGLSCSLFTPNRVGEYGGRVMMVSPQNRLLAIWATMVGISSQWIVLVVGGWWGLMGAFYGGLIPIHEALLSSLILVGGVASSCLLGIYFNLRKIVPYSMKFKWTRNWAMKMQRSSFDYYNNKELIEALGYSITRYWIYSSQYVCLLFFFGFDANILSAFLGVIIVYLLQTGIPLPPSTGLLARGNIAVLILGYLTVKEDASMAILSATFSLWMINVVLPSVVGAFLIARLGWNEKEAESEEQMPVTSSRECTIQP
ncbi:lysylphosphatidylglycerol synthase domain-containing protein [Aureispira sp. CCB-QB1]|uniref:lysylphosphatidylglycerol synthase domain-containing protein n=1 Tax=Aureispira sp. CCB-QB1 TaxID=1313421 RepID=UPI0006975D2B|nr:lysylphosphatidylglycerol synthase domain-containing protein [Aureispira sp. CCB-QB1]